MAKATKATITIRGEKYALNFGLRFLKEIGVLPNQLERNNEVYSEIIGGLLDGDPYALLTVIKASLATQEALSDKEIEEWFEQEATVEELFENFPTYLASAPLLAKKVKPMITLAEKVQAQVDKEMEKIVQA